MTLSSLAHRLSIYDEQEARSIVRILLEDCFHISYTDICCGALNSLSPEELSRLDSLMTRLDDGEPVQYVTGKAMFYGNTFHVAPGVLIPRPETELLIDIIKHSTTTETFCNKLKPTETFSILDIGTGSGCIAITLAKEIEGAHVTAWDISPEALQIAQYNADCLHANVSFLLQDALHAPDISNRFDVIVSNPPYVCNKEKKSMQRNVLDHEPHLALFVPDDDPLLFYRRITAFAKNALRKGGILAFEINPLFSKELLQLIPSASLIKDQFGKERFLLARN